MHMSFHNGFHEVILFDSWFVQSRQDLGYAVAGIAILGIIYEAVKSYRATLYAKAAREREFKGKRSKLELIFTSSHFGQTILHAIQLIIGYALMLIVMTYNVWLCLAVVVGATLGYWLFSSDKSNGDNIDCCL